MKLLEERILSEGRILPGGILKVDGFLNHRIDPILTRTMAGELKRLFEGEGVNKILTVEASGIALGIMTADAFGCPLVFAKKTRSSNISRNVYSCEVESFTHGVKNTVLVSREYLSETDKVLVVDDFLATGAALRGLRNLVEQAGGKVVGCGIAIEKVFQGGGNELRAEGLRIESLAKIAAMDENSITFC